VKKAKSNNKPGRAPLKPPDPSKPVYSYLCPECDKPYGSIFNQYLVATYFSDILVGKMSKNIVRKYTK
jgi:hypothetical protein